MKKLFLLSLLVFLFPFCSYLQNKTFVREYTYNAGAGDNDSTSRAIALDRVKRALCEEIAKYLESESDTTGENGYNPLNGLSYEQVKGVIPIVTQMNILEEKSDAGTFYIKASIAINSRFVLRDIAWTTGDMIKVMEFEEADRRADSAEGIINGLHNELSSQTDENERKKEQADYVFAANMLSAVDFFQRGHNAVERGDYHEGIMLYSKAIELDPKYTYAYSSLGVAYANIGEDDLAIAIYEKAIEMDSSHSFIYSNLGNSYLREGKYETAIPLYQKAIEVDSSYTPAYYNLGIAYYDEGEIDKAISSYEKAIEMNPDYVAAYINLGLAYHSKGEDDKAISACEKAIELNPASTNAYVGLANAYLASDTEKAIEMYSKAVELDPYYSPAYTDLGNVYYDRADYDMAELFYKKAIELDPKDSDSHYDLGNVYYRKGELDSAIQFYQKAIELDPRSPRAYHNLGVAYGKKGDSEKQVECYQKAAQLGNAGAQNWLTKNGYTW